MSLSRDTSHTFPAEPPADEWMECQDCGMPLPPGSEPRSLCKGMKQWHKLSRTGSLDRSTPLSSVSDSNSGREHQKDEAFREYVRSLPCLVCGAPPKNDPAHVKNWGAGWGDWVGGEGNLYPACRKHHDEEENAIGGGPETFQAEHGIDLAAEARRIGREYRKQSEMEVQGG